MLKEFKNKKAADDFWEKYDNEVKKLGFFPIGYRGIGLDLAGMTDKKLSCLFFILINPLFLTKLDIHGVFLLIQRRHKLIKRRLSLRSTLINPSIL